ncbi:MAG: hypothetical protein JWR38_564 [Mucilaginibacter sp.]|nr:hypothetical protein [Mucilaginibacter sp.]
MNGWLYRLYIIIQTPIIQTPRRLVPYCAVIIYENVFAVFVGLSGLSIMTKQFLQFVRVVAGAIYTSSKYG